MTDMTALQRAAPALAAASSNTPLGRLMTTFVRAAITLMVVLIGYGMFRNGGVAPHHKLLHAPKYQNTSNNNAQTTQRRSGGSRRPTIRACAQQHAHGNYSSSHRHRTAHGYGNGYGSGYTSGCCSGSDLETIPE